MQVCGRALEQMPQAKNRSDGETSRFLHPEIDAAQHDPEDCLQAPSLDTCWPHMPRYGRASG
ncbi:MAG: hypothetical protein BGP05_10740 [Rhizobiales bacterium 62-47]|nr:MAG: hypothetical protein BGP05_10740 [Rhizobiales bacterium 62-47]